jgi:hypothetical protein
MSVIGVRSGPLPSRIWLSDPASGETVPLFEDDQVAGSGPQWSPVGQCLAFYSLSDAAVLVYDFATGESTRFETLSGTGSWGPDGRQMAIPDTTYRGEREVSYVVRVDLEGGQALDLSQPEATGSGDRYWQDASPRLVADRGVDRHWAVRIGRWNVDLGATALVDPSRWERSLSVGHRQRGQSGSVCLAVGWQSVGVRSGDRGESRQPGSRTMVCRSTRKTAAPARHERGLARVVALRLKSDGDRVLWIVTGVSLLLAQEMGSAQDSRGARVRQLARDKCPGIPRYPSFYRQLTGSATWEPAYLSRAQKTRGMGEGMIHKMSRSRRKAVFLAGAPMGGYVARWGVQSEDGVDVVLDRMETQVDSRLVSILGFACSQAAR